MQGLKSHLRPRVWLPAIVAILWGRETFTYCQYALHVVVAVNRCRTVRAFCYPFRSAFLAARSGAVPLNISTLNVTVAAYLRDFIVSHRSPFTSPARPQVIERTRPPELGAHIGPGKVRVPQRHRQCLVSEYLAHQFQVAGLTQDTGRRVVSELVGSHENRQSGSAAETMQHVQGDRK